MDILVSSNFERLMWYLAFEGIDRGKREQEKHNMACSLVEKWMSRVKSEGRVEVSVEVLQAARQDFFAERVDDELVRRKNSFNKSLN